MAPIRDRNRTRTLNAVLALIATSNRVWTYGYWQAFFKCPHRSRLERTVRPSRVRSVSCTDPRLCSSLTRRRPAARDLGHGTRVNKTDWVNRKRGPIELKDEHCCKDRSAHSKLKSKSDWTRSRLAAAGTRNTRIRWSRIVRCTSIIRRQTVGAIRKRKRTINESSPTLPWTHPREGGTVHMRIIHRSLV